MANGINDIGLALRKVFSDRKYIVITILSAIIMFGVLIFLPVGRVSIKVFYYQVTGLDITSLITMIFFSIMLGMLFSLNFYLLKKTHESKKNIAGKGIVSMLSSLMAGIFGSAVCVTCLSILLGFLGLPIITFLVSYRKEFFLLAAVIALASFYFACRAVVEHETCKTCSVQV